MESTIYDIKVKKINGEEQSLKDFAGKVLVVVNVASKCGFTPQYKDLELIYKKYKDRGLEILGFPCNQFGSQEPGTEDDIKSFCDLNYGVTFPIFKKIDVNGENASPLFEVMKNALPGILGLKMIKWNFTKFLIDKNGRPVSRYAPKDGPNEMLGEIEKLLNEKIN